MLASFSLGHRILASMAGTCYTGLEKDLEYDRSLPYYRLRFLMMNIVAPVELLKRQYLQLTDPEELTLPRKEVLRLPDIQAQIYNDMFDESNIVYAPPERYRFRVLKRLVKALEDAIEDPEEDVGAFSFRILLFAAFNSPILQDSLTVPLLICPHLSRVGDLRCHIRVPGTVHGSAFAIGKRSSTAEKLRDLYSANSWS